MFGRSKVAGLLAEFLAGAALTLVVLSVQRSTIGVPYFVAIAAGLTAAMLVFVFGSVSGGHGNPAITLALWTARKVGTLTAALYIVLQVLGGWAAYHLYTYFINNSLQPIAVHYSGRLLVAEAVGTLVLALGWAAISFRSNLTAGGRAALVGVSYTLAVIVAAGAGLGLVNPAVAEGVRAWTVFGSTGWGTYLLGPVLGAVIGINLYGLLFAPAAAANDEAVVLEEVVVSETVSAPAVAATTAATTTAAKKRKTTASKASASKTTAKKPTTRKAATAAKSTRGRAATKRTKK